MIRYGTIEIEQNSWSETGYAKVFLLLSGKRVKISLKSVLVEIGIEWLETTYDFKLTFLLSRCTTHGLLTRFPAYFEALFIKTGLRSWSQNQRVVHILLISNGVGVGIGFQFTDFDSPLAQRLSHWHHCSFNFLVRFDLQIYLFCIGMGILYLSLNRMIKPNSLDNQIISKEDRSKGCDID